MNFSGCGLSDQKRIFFRGRGFSDCALSEQKNGRFCGQECYKKNRALVTTTRTSTDPGFCNAGFVGGSVETATGISLGTALRSWNFTTAEALKFLVQTAGILFGAVRPVHVQSQLEPAFCLAL